jgi:hypothetical protein
MILILGEILSPIVKDPLTRSYHHTSIASHALFRNFSLVDAF